MKKIFVYVSIIILILIIGGVIMVWKSVIHVQLPHGAVLHVLPVHKDDRTHSAVILCPGGGYGYLEKWNEGYCWFPFFYRQGFAVAMLEYRMPNQDCQVPVTDGAEAVRLMREHAEEWGFDEDNVGVMGFSAGGHLASTLLVSDRASVRPDFGILIYPVISMKKELTHRGSHDRLLGEDASEELEDRYSVDLHVSDSTPPAYIALSGDDPTVNPQNSIRFHDRMRTHNRPVTLHVYSSGGHGWGYRRSFPYHSEMLDDLADWLRDREKNKPNK
jgi:acetyl esterase/lipase